MRYYLFRMKLYEVLNKYRRGNIVELLKVLYKYIMYVFK